MDNCKDHYHYLTHTHTHTQRELEREREREDVHGCNIRKWKSTVQGSERATSLLSRIRSCLLLGNHLDTSTIKVRHS